MGIIKENKITSFFLFLSSTQGLAAISCDNSSSSLECFIKSQKISISSGKIWAGKWHQQEVFPGKPLDTSSPPALLQVCPKSFIRPRKSPFSFFYSQIKLGFVGKCDPESKSANNLEALIPATTTKILFLAFPRQKRTAESRNLSAPTFKKQENPSKNSPHCVVLTTHGRNSARLHPELLSSWSSFGEWGVIRWLH